MILGMKKLPRFLSIAILTQCFIAPAFAQLAAPEISPKPSGMTLSLDLLSDPDGANISPYVRNLISDLRKHWLPLVTELASRPLPKPQETLISLMIAPDGRVLAMKLEKPEPDTVLDKAAWNATKGTTYLPPPTGMKDPNLKLRVHFVFN
jgi:TonB family protein